VERDVVRSGHRCRSWRRSYDYRRRLGFRPHRCRRPGKHGPATRDRRSYPDRHVDHRRTPRRRHLLQSDRVHPGQWQSHVLTRCSGLENPTKKDGATDEVGMFGSRLFGWLAAAALSLTIFGTAPAWAKDAEDVPGSPAEFEHKGGPQIFTPVRIDLGIWTIVVFLILFFLLKKYAWGPMLTGLQKREENISTALEEAQKARDEAKKIRDDL